MYQSSSGGSVYIPLEIGARIIGKSTPRFSKMLSWKYANLPAAQVQKDLEAHHGLNVSVKLIQSVNQRVGDIMIDKETKWTYTDDVDREEVATIGISRDGTTVPIKKEGYKETMAGTIALYNQSGDRLHTIYCGCAPEHGKATFDAVFSQHIEAVKRKYPQARRVGIADGEKGNWTFLEQYTDKQLLDFWHATEYLGAYAKVAYPDEKDRKEWLARSCHKLKHSYGGSTRLLNEMKQYAKAHKLANKEHPVIRAVTYFTNQKPRMQYWKYVEQGVPIGSGVVEAACKTLVKQRLSKSGCKWTRHSVDHILLSRSLILSDGYWDQFWSKIDRYGI